MPAVLSQHLLDFYQGEQELIAVKNKNNLLKFNYSNYSAKRK